MKTIVIQLLECMVLSEDEYYKMRDSGHTLDDYAPEGVYNYYKLGKRKIMAVLNSELLTSALIPMLREFYSVYGDKKYSQQYNAVLRELNKLEKISYERCEHLSYDNEEAFYPVFINNPNLKPFLMYEDGVKADCTGIVLCAIPPEIATFSMLYTLEQEIQNKLSGHNLCKALKVCIDDYMQ